MRAGQGTKLAIGLVVAGGRRFFGLRGIAIAVMAEMLRAFLLFDSAILRRHGKCHLQRQDDEKEKGDGAAHGQMDYARTGCSTAARETCDEAEQLRTFARGIEQRLPLGTLDG